MSEKLLGNATPEATAVSAAAGQIYSYPLEPEKSGTLEEIQVRTGTGAMLNITGVVAGLYADASGLPGALLGQAEKAGKPEKSEWRKITGLSIEVTAGTKYHVGVLSLGGTLSLLGKNGGTVTPRSTVTTFTKLEETASWVKTLNRTPLSVQGFGTAGESFTDSQSGTITISGTGTDEYEHAGLKEFTDAATGSLTTASGEGTEDEFVGPGTVGEIVHYGAGEFQFLSKWKAPLAPNAPIVVCVHGGGWAGGPAGAAEFRSWNEFIEAWQNTNGKLSKTYNVAAAAIEYYQAHFSSTPNNTAFPANVEDAVKATEYVIKNAASFGGDPKRVFLAGNSAGASVAAMAAALLGDQVVGVLLLSIFESDIRLLVQEVEANTGSGKIINENEALTKHWQWALQQNKPGSTLIKTPGALKTSEPAAWPFQEEWSANRRAVSGRAAWRIWGSEIEVVSPAQGVRMQEHLETEGKWDSRCKQILRIAGATQPETASHYLERHNTEGEPGHGHALAYFGEIKPEFLAFIETTFPADEGTGKITVSGTGTDVFERIVAPTEFVDQMAGTITTGGVSTNSLSVESARAGTITASGEGRDVWEPERSSISLAFAGVVTAGHGS